MCRCASVGCAPGGRAPGVCAPDGCARGVDAHSVSGGVSSIVLDHVDLRGDWAGHYFLIGVCSQESIYQGCRCTQGVGGRPVLPSLAVPC